MNCNFVKAYFKELSEVMGANVDYLIDLDSVAGDGDLGLTMSDGFKAAYENVASSEESDLGKVFYSAGKAMGSAVPSTMGTLMAKGLMQVGKELKGKAELPDVDMYIIFSSYQEGVAQLGKAKVGEKTFLDGLAPAVKALKDHSNVSLLERCRLAYAASEKGYKETKDMIAVYGRAAIRGEASRSFVDPGAAVAMLMMKALVQAVEGLNR